jgi:hypothetical protein
VGDSPTSQRQDKRTQSAKSDQYDEGSPTRTMTYFFDCVYFGFGLFLHDEGVGRRQVGHRRSDERGQSLGGRRREM